MSFYTKFAQYYESIFPFKQPIFDFLKSNTRQETKDILDIGCGTGHYSTAFSQAGFRTTGIDLDASMIDYAKEHYHDTTFHRKNMLDIDTLDRHFDLAFCIGNTIAHLTKSEFDSFINIVRNILRPGGIWIFQVRNWDYVIQHKEYNFPTLKTNGGRLQFYRSYTNITTDSLQFNTRLTDENKLIFKGTH